MSYFRNQFKDCQYTTEAQRAAVASRDAYQKVLSDAKNPDGCCELGCTDVACPVGFAGCAAATDRWQLSVAGAIIGHMETPKIASAEEWQLERDGLLKTEKEITRAQDALAARRRRLPMVKFSDGYVFDTPQGAKSLVELFDGRKQLVTYQFMDLGPDHYCPGCTGLTHNVPVAALNYLVDYDVTWVTVSNMPLAQIEAYKAQMGWTLPFVSSHGTSFADDCGAGGGFMLSVFLRDGEDAYLTYNTTSRGVDRLVFANSVLDLTPYGRQEDWEDSPAGWPQHPTYG